MDYRTEAPPLIRDFLVYHETIQGHSRQTVDEYYLDLRSFARYLKQVRDPSLRSVPLDHIPLDDVSLELFQSVTLTDVYSYMNFLTRDKGLNAASRARKVATIRSFYKYLTNKAKLLTKNPVQDLDSPRQKKSLPKYLSLDESIDLLESVDGKNATRDFCILTLFLNCGLRISELVNLNVTDVRDNQLRVLGKGNKERILFLNDACVKAIQDWMTDRNALTLIDQNALFVTLQNRRRISVATLMLQNGVDVRTLQEVLGHDHLNTTQIYTHVDNDDLRAAARANPLAGVKKRRKVLDSGENNDNRKE